MQKKIAIVDDESYVRLLLQQTLEELNDKGVLLLTAENGKEALDIIVKETPELVFLDIMMPELNGFDVCDTVKNKLGMTKVYIVMLTGKGQVFDKQRGLNTGVDVYMTKPFDPDDVLELAIKVLALE